MFETGILLVSCLFKASGSFWALTLARKCIVGAQNGGLYLFLYVAALLLVWTATLVLIDCTAEFFFILNHESNDEGNDDLLK